MDTTPAAGAEAQHDTSLLQVGEFDESMPMEEPTIRAEEIVYNISQSSPKKKTTALGTFESLERGIQAIHLSSRNAASNNEDTLIRNSIMSSGGSKRRKIDSPMKLMETRAQRSMKT